MKRGHVAAVVLALLPSAAQALNKQGTREGGPAPDGEFWSLAGDVGLGAFVANRTYAARPDNTGLAAGRLALHADLDLLWGRITASYDLGGFTSRAGALALTEVDHIAGLALHLGPADVALHYEKDLPVDRGGLAPSLVDAQLRLALPAWGEAVGLGGYLGCGPLLAGSFAARPDNTGRAALRAIAHLEARLPWRWVVARLEMVGLTDRGRPAALSELDVALTAGVRWGALELSVLAEQDRPVDRGGLVQSYVALLVGHHFGGSGD